MKKIMYLLTNIPYGNKQPCGYCYDNGYYIYQVIRDDDKIYSERLFKNVETALEVLLTLRKEEECQLIH